MVSHRWIARWRRLYLVAILAGLCSSRCAFSNAFLSSSFISTEPRTATKKSSFASPVIQLLQGKCCSMPHVLNLPLVRWMQEVPRHTLLSMGGPKDWDAILAEEDSNDTPSRKSKIPYDMRYNQRNCERSSKNFVAIKEAGGPGADIYGCVASKSEDEGVFWFLGKVAHISDVTLSACVARLWPLIQQHAGNLRPLDLFGAVTNEELELWCAPLDSEFDVAYNRPQCVFQKMEATNIPPNAETINVNYVGFQGEVYDRGEEGFRTRRFRSTGFPSRPEITGPVEEKEEEEEEDPMAPSDEQMALLEKALEGKDINAIYEEQERRRQNDN